MEIPSYGKLRGVIELDISELADGLKLDNICAPNSASGRGIKSLKNQNDEYYRIGIFSVKQKYVERT